MFCWPQRKVAPGGDLRYTFADVGDEFYVIGVCSEKTKT